MLQQKIQQAIRNTVFKSYHKETVTTKSWSQHRTSRPQIFVKIKDSEAWSAVEVDLSANLLVELPETFGELKNLKSLMLNNNGLRSLPTSLFKMCVQLSTLNVHGTQITMDVLRQIEGWEEFDNRRRLKLRKQFDFRVSNSGNFDEGADKS